MMVCGKRVSGYMKKLLVLLTMGLSLGAIPHQPAHAQKLSVSAARSQIKTCYNRYEQAMKAKDLNVINGLLSSDYTAYTMSGHSSDRNTALNSTRMLFRLPVSYARYETNIVSIQPRGLDMIVNTQVTAVTVAKSGTRSGDSKVIVKYRDFWSPMKNANGWVLRQSVEMSGEAWINGKKMG
jgi:hypothetical protein